MALQHLIDEQKRRGKKAVDDESAKLRELVRSAQKELRDARKAIRAAKDARALEEARQRIVAGEAALPTPEVAVPVGGPLTSVAVGDDVYVPRLRSAATVLEGPARGKVRVAAGALKLWVKVEELQAGVKRVAATRPAQKKTEEKDGERRHDPRGLDNTLDLRGMRVDDALDLTEAFLDRVYGANGRTAYVVHGIGTGALRDAVRKALKQDNRYVASFRAGATDEGGDRLTVVTLR